jgi:hypothetical protein
VQATTTAKAIAATKPVIIMGKSFVFLFSTFIASVIPRHKLPARKMQGS